MRRRIKGRSEMYLVGVVVNNRMYHFDKKYLRIEKLEVERGELYRKEKKKLHIPEGGLIPRTEEIKLLEKKLLKLCKKYAVTVERRIR